MNVWRNWDPCIPSGDIWIAAAIMKSRMEIPQKLTSQFATWCCNPISEYTFKITESRIWMRSLHTHVNCNTVQRAKRWNQSKGLLMNEWIKCGAFMQQNIHYSIFKRKEILSHTATWMNFEDVMHSGISQSQKARYHMIPCTWNS